MHADWPEEIRRQIEALLGPGPEVTNPGGMSGASVLRLAGNGRTVILKRSWNAAEWHVYCRSGVVLRAAGVSMPALLGATASNSQWWLLLEDIDQPLPENRRLADPDVIQTLRNLHGIPPGSLHLPPDRYKPAWPEPLTSQTLSLFEESIATDLAVPLERIRTACQPLFEPLCPVSGDPNPANWGVRPDGSPVLFDWERFTLATPALDLAITVPGLGTWDDFSAVSRAYTGHEQLAPAIAHAKAWSVIEFLAGCASGEIEPAFDLNALVSGVPSWIGSELAPLHSAMERSEVE